MIGKDLINFKEEDPWDASVRLKFAGSNEMKKTIGKLINKPDVCIGCKHLQVYPIIMSDDPSQYMILEQMPSKDEGLMAELITKKILSGKIWHIKKTMTKRSSL